MRGTVLLAEDEDQVNRLMAKVLEMGGYRVLAAATSLHALQLSESHRGEIDLLVADLELDARMDGHELARRLRRDRPRLRVLYTSGYPLDYGGGRGVAKIRGEVLEWVAAFLPKPFTPALLAESVRRAMTAVPG